MVLLSNWEDQIIYGPDIQTNPAPVPPKDTLTTAVNADLESGAWTQSIIWDTNTPFKDFTQIEFNEEDMIQEERHSGMFITFMLSSSQLIDFHNRSYEA